MEESLITTVLDSAEDTVELEIRNNGGDVLEFYLNRKLIFSGDWDGNFLQIFQRALELWDEKEEH